MKAHLAVLFFALFILTSATSHAEKCIEKGITVEFPPINPNDYSSYYYGFSIHGICSAAAAASMSETATFKTHREGYYLVKMKAYVKTAKQLYNSNFTARSYESAADRVNVEANLAQALANDSRTGVSKGLSLKAQERFSNEIMPLFAQILKLREDQVTNTEAAELRDKALEQWLKILAESGQ